MLRGEALRENWAGGPRRVRADGRFVWTPGCPAVRVVPPKRTTRAGPAGRRPEDIPHNVFGISWKVNGYFHAKYQRLALRSRVWRAVWTRVPARARRRGVRMASVTAVEAVGIPLTLRKLQANVSFRDQAYVALKQAIQEADIYGQTAEIRLDER